MEASIEHVRGLLLVGIAGRLDTSTASAFDAQMGAELARPWPRILIDLGGVTYISSAGLRSILKLIKHAAAYDGGVSLYGASPHIMEVIEISGFPGLVKIFPDRTSALEAHP